MALLSGDGCGHICHSSQRGVTILQISVFDTKNRNVFLRLNRQSVPNAPQCSNKIRKKEVGGETDDKAEEMCESKPNVGYVSLVCVTLIPSFL